MICAGLSRRAVGWRGDLCAGVPAAAAAGVPALPAVEQHLEEFLRVYPERIAKTHGPLRPVVGECSSRSRIVTSS